MGAAIRVVRRAELHDAVGTPGIHRRAAFEGEDHWFGHVETEPNVMSGWHHHGDTLTIGYVARGEVGLEYGPGGRDSVQATAGDFFIVPPHVVHREGNPTGQPAEIVLGRFGPGSPVFPAAGPDLH